MARSSSMGGSRTRMSGVVAGDRVPSKSVVRTSSGTTDVTAGAPVTNLGANIKTRKAITDRVPAYGEKPVSITKPTRAKTVADIFGVAKAPTKYTPGSYAAYRKTLPGFVAVAKGKKPAAPVAVAVKPPAKKPVVVKPAAKKLAPSVLRSALGMAPTKKATPSTKPPATRFGVVTGTKTGTRVSDGGGYGGGGTRGSGSLSGQGSGSRSMGTSRTGGTRGNNPVRG